MSPARVEGVTAKAVLQRFFDEVVNAGRLDAVDALLAPELRDGARSTAAMWREAFPDLVLRVDAMIGEGDAVAAAVTITGTHRGELQLPVYGTVAPTGRRATWGGMDYVRIADGLIVERRSPRDLLRLLIQLGAVVPRAGSSA